MPVPGPDHDDRFARIIRQAEAVRLLQIDLEAGPRRHPVGEERGGHAEPRALVDVIAHRVDRQVHLAGRRQRRRRYRIQPRLQRLQALQERFRIGMDRAERLQRREHVEGGSIAVRIVACCKQLRLLALGAARHVADQLEQRIGRRAQRIVLDQRLPERLAAHREIRWRAHRRQHRIGKLRVVARIEPEAVARRIAEAGGRNVDHDVARVLLRARRVEARRRSEDGLDRLIAAVAALAGLLRRCGVWRWRVAHRRNRGRRHLLEQPLQHAARFLAAGNAQVELGLRPRRDGRRVGLAQIAALSAILLRHGREQLALQRPPFGKLHALVDRHGGVVPGGLAVVTVSGQRPGGSAGQLAGHRRDAGLGVERQQAGEETVEPGALLHRERRAVGDTRARFPCAPPAAPALPWGGQGGGIQSRRSPLPPLPRGGDVSSVVWMLIAASDRPSPSARRHRCGG